MHRYAATYGFDNWSSIDDLTDAVNTPTFSPVAGDYISSQNVAISCATPSSTIYYTTDGSTPTTGSTVYVSPIAVASDTTIKAFATAADLPDSAVATAVYVISDGITVAASVLDATSARITIGSVEAVSGTFYVVVVASGGGTPSAAQIEAGTDASDVAAAWSTAVSVLDTDDVIRDATGLSAIEYVAYAVQKDGTGTYSAVASSAAFTPADVTAPILTSPIGTATGNTTATVSVNTDTPEGTLYVVITKDGTTPSAANVIAGNNAAGDAATWSDSVTVTDHGPQSFAATLLEANTEQWVYFCHVDAAGNQSTVTPGVASFTTENPVIIGEWFNDGIATGYTYTGATGTGSQSDHDAGTNAVLITNDGATSASVQINSVTFRDGVNRLSLSLRDVTKSTAKRWARIRVLNTTSVPIVAWNVTDGTIGSTPSGSGHTITDEGGGWYRLTYTFDFSGDGDLDGSIAIYLADADNDQTIPAGSGGEEEMAIYNVVLSDGDTITGDGAGTGEPMGLLMTLTQA